jgi:hypothetical protein
LSTALAKVPLHLPVKRRKLKAEDVSNAKLSTIDRATILAYPHAVQVSQWLAENNGRPLANRVLMLPLPKDDHYGKIIIPDARTGYSVLRNRSSRGTRTGVR